MTALDTPNDGGGSITIKWGRSPDEGAGQKTVVGYEILRAGAPEGPFKSVGFASAGQTSYRDPSVKDGEASFYRVVAVTESGERGESAIAGPAVSSQQWFNRDRWNILLISGFLFAAVIYFIERGRRGERPFVRRIAGLDALEEAIGRATEMGRPILFSPGTQDMNDVQTVAAITILAHVARKAAAYDTRLKVPNRFSLVMTTARETVKESCLAAGRPDSYREDDIFYISDEQFGYVAGVSGMIVREQPATCLYLGAFFAESLVLAEMGNSIGAIQIGGTAQPAQLPFFVAACDYTLIGEELFAASAYLSGEPHQLGSLKGQDLGKVLALSGIAAGSLLATFAAFSSWPFLETAAAGLRSFFMNR
ncbi:MAG: hypothetical protein DMF49_04020 [Acidobacteria bacterium]|nr:MAG: hypothetical protein DMF49_04020 [Acidobacteriota bacterium]